MKTAQLILTVVLAAMLAGCLVKGQPKVTTPPAPQPAPAPAPPAPAAAPQPLSLPQTQVQLPPEQPLDPGAFALAQPAEVHTETPPATRPTRPRQPKPSAPPATTVAVPPASPPVVTAPPETERGTVQEVLPPAERQRLKTNADNLKRTIRNWLASSRGRRVDPNDPTVARIRSLLQTSDEEEEKGNVREAFDLAEHAMSFLRELQSGR